MFDGIAVFKTYTHDYPGLSLKAYTQIFRYEGTQPPRLFYSPAYRTEAQRSSRLPDYRHTLLWQPQLEASDGRARIPFTTSDLKGDFLITLEGLTESGKRIYTTGFIKVE